MPQELEDIQIDMFNLNLKKDVKYFNRMFPLNRSFNVHENPYESLSPLQLSDFDHEDHELEQHPEFELEQRDSDQSPFQKRKTIKKRHHHSMVDQRELKKIFNELQE